MLTAIFSPWKRPIMSAPLVFIDDDQGTTGLQIYERLRDRVEQQDLKLLMLPAGVRKDVQRRAEVISVYDIVILCLSDATAREAVAVIINPRVRMIDASSVRRTAPGWVYGFPEIGNE